MFTEKNENPFDLMMALPPRIRPIPDVVPCFFCEIGDVEIEISVRGEAGFELLKRSSGRTTAVHQIRGSSTLGVAAVDDWIESVRYDLISSYQWNKEFVAKRHYKSLKDILLFIVPIERGEEAVSRDGLEIINYIRTFEMFKGSAYIRCNDELSLLFVENDTEFPLRLLSEVIGISPGVSICSSTSGSIFITSGIIRLSRSMEIDAIGQLRMLANISSKHGQHVSELIEMEIQKNRILNQLI